jgi:AGZA family xanthine/uracil permease-like MFS transporter
LLGAIAVFIIERQLYKAALASMVGGALTSFGFMHGEAIGVGQTPGVAAAYLAVATFLYGCARFAPAAVASASPHAEVAEVALEPAE